MEIRKTGYIPWQGTLRESGWRGWPIFKHGVATVFQRKKAKLLFAFASLPFLIFAVAVYASLRPELRMMTRMVKELGSDLAIFHSFYTNNFLLFTLVILALFSGGDAVALDRKHNAFPLLFARPLSRFDYLTGKLSYILFYLLLFSLVPGILLLTIKVVFSGSLSLSPRLILAALTYPLAPALLFGSLTLGFSAVTKNEHVAKVSIFGFYVASDILSNIVLPGRIFTRSNLGFLSPQQNLKRFGNLLFGFGDETAGKGIIAILIILFWSGLALWITYRRVGKEG